MTPSAVLLYPIAASALSGIFVIPCLSINANKRSDASVLLASFAPELWLSLLGICKDQRSEVMIFIIHQLGIAMPYELTLMPQERGACDAALFLLLCANAPNQYSHSPFSTV